MHENIGVAILLTTIAGLSTAVGGLIVFFVKETNRKFLSLSLGFSAGVMIYVSFIDILTEAQHILQTDMGDKVGALAMAIAFFFGILIIYCIDLYIPESHPTNNIDIEDKTFEQKRLMRTGIFMAVALAIHNLPEGIITFVSALYDPKVAIPIAVAIAIWNIPEGITVSVPIYYATGNRFKALLYSFLSGLTEPLGAIVGYLLLLPLLSDFVYGIVFAAVAGIMIYISFNTLLPVSREYGGHKLSMLGMFSGMAFMSFSLILFM